jgi:hypothetical protein
METFYVTLVRELGGYCIKAHAPNEIALRKHLFNTYGKLWCSTYTEKPTEELIGKTLYVDEDE